MSLTRREIKSPTFMSDVDAHIKWNKYYILGDFKREDLARALLHMVCTDLAQTAFLTLKSSDIKTAFLVGGFGNSALAREMFTEEFMFRTLNRVEVMYIM